MKIFQITLVACVLTAALLTGCRNRPADTSVPSTAPSSAATTTPRQTTPSTAPTTVPMPSATMPNGTDVTPGTQSSEGILDGGNGGMHGGTDGGMSGGNGAMARGLGGPRF